jgi:hypothetical protein
MPKALYSVQSLTRQPSSQAIWEKNPQKVSCPPHHTHSLSFLALVLVQRGGYPTDYAERHTNLINKDHHKIIVTSRQPLSLPALQSHGTNNWRIIIIIIIIIIKHWTPLDPPTNFPEREVYLTLPSELTSSLNISFKRNQKREKRYLALFEAGPMFPT